MTEAAEATVMASATDEQDEAVGSGEVETTSSAKKRLGTMVAATYRITRHIGSGGSSHVFEAEHLRLGKSFAVKVLRPELDTSRLTAQRFRREAKAVARLHSEHIVSVVDCGELDDGAPYLVMELLVGEDLRGLLNREGALPARRAVRLIVEACRGLSVVHQAGLVHRDLKPENLFVTRRSTGEDWCKVLDFGVAKMEASLSTAEGAIIGTARYMAPEQLSDGASIGPATDVYALGAILYECLSGQPAHAGETIQKVMFGVMNHEPEALSSRCPAVPRVLAATVTRCLAKQPARRPQTVAELERLLSTVLAGGHPNTNATLSEDAARPPLGADRAAPAGWRYGMALALAVLAGAVVAWSVKPTVPAKLSANAPLAKMPARPTVFKPPAPPSSPVAPPPVSATSDLIGRNLMPEPSRSTHTAPPRPTPPARPTRSALPTGRPPTGPVGSLDQANPYGE
jgi:serine/threonine-protein kinase